MSAFPLSYGSHLANEHLATAGCRIWQLNGITIEIVLCPLTVVTLTYCLGACLVACWYQFSRNMNVPQYLGEKRVTIPTMMA